MPPGRKRRFTENAFPPGGHGPFLWGGVRILLPLEKKRELSGRGTELKADIPQRSELAPPGQSWL